MWNWHRGNPEPLTPTSDKAVDELIAQLGSESDIEGLQASYELGTRVEAAIPSLIQSL